MSIPSLRQLHFLVAHSFADTLNFYGVQPRFAMSLSRRCLPGLKELEQSLGVVLAERTKRSVLLTPIGQETAERARRVLTMSTTSPRLRARAARGPR